MARIRTIKPEFFTHSGLGELSAHHRLLFAGLWTQADRDGRLKDDPKKLKVVLLPYDDVDVDAMLTGLAEYEEAFITRYEVKGEKYIQINNFLDHQHPHIKEPQSTMPAPCKTGARTRRAPVRPAVVGREGKGKEGDIGREGDRMEIPDWIPVEPWQGFLEMREAKKKKPTSRALQLIIDKLAQWRERGHDPAEILNKATVNGWTDVYEPKTEQGAPNGTIERNQGHNHTARTQAGGIRGDTSRFAGTAEKFDGD